MKKIPNILIKVFIIIFILQLIGVIFILFIPKESQAIEFKPQVDIPVPEFEKVKGTVGPDTIGNYISAIYKYATGIVGILAAVVLMVGGVMWITAAGNQTRIGEAKAWITAALTGLVIAMASFMILYTVNPELTKFRPIEPTEIKASVTGCCETGNNNDDYAIISQYQCNQINGEWGGEGSVWGSTGCITPLQEWCLWCEVCGPSNQCATAKCGYMKSDDCIMKNSYQKFGGDGSCGGFNDDQNYHTAQIAC